MKRSIVLMALALSLWPGGSVEAGDAMAAALQQVKALAMRPVPSVPAPAQPREEWVSERRVWVPGAGGFAIVPGHWERRISATQSSVPPLTIFREDDRRPLAVPAGERPPADLRSGP
ncbi:MAG: hypothetical protein HY725_05445 [Candidatus Rokubacteria bacterium]|nr:hypothetical protein [Candidatus Rokubacteria bacterium]